MTGPLEGMRVLDLSQQLPGPYATFLLASMGAEVIKVEPPGGDAARRLDPTMFEHVNAGKASVVLDLKSATDRAELLGLAAGCDVFVEGFRPGVTARLGCSESEVRAVSPRVVYCSISGMGQSGPLAAHPTHDLSLQALVGSLAEAPTDRIGVPWVDLATATTAALSIVAAWHDRRPVHLDLSMLDAARSWSAVKPLAVREPEATYGVVRAADGHVVVALLEDHMWQRLCVALGWDDWAGDPDLGTYLQRREHARRIRARVDATFARRSVADLLALAEQHDLPIGAVDGTLDPQGRAQLAARGRDDTATGRFTALPLDLSGPLAPAPPLEEDPS